MMKITSGILTGLIGAVDLYAAHLGFAADVSAGEITSGRAAALVAAGVGLISVVVGALALARRLGRVGAIIALVLGLIGVALSAAHLAGSTGFGTGGGRLGAIVGLVLGLIGAILGVVTLARVRDRGEEY